MRPLSFVVVTAGLLAAPLVVADEVPNATIVASTAPDLPVGRTVGDTEQVYVPPNASISVIFRDGRTATVHGPSFGVLVPNSSASMAQSPYLSLGHDGTVVGASRGAQSGGGLRGSTIRVYRTRLIADRQHREPFATGSGSGANAFLRRVIASPFDRPSMVAFPRRALNVHWQKIARR
jgi:hypothetical protein